MQVGEIVMKAMSAPQLEPATRGQKYESNKCQVIVTRIIKQHTNSLVLLNYTRPRVEFKVVPGSNCGGDPARGHQIVGSGAAKRDR